LITVNKLSFVLLALSLPVLSRAQLLLFTTTLSGSQEVPANASLGTGSGTASLDLATDFFTFNDTFSGLSSADTASHIHAPGLPGVSAPVIIPFTLASGFVVGQTFGSISYSGTLTPLQAAELEAGQFYVNVHTTNFPGGEIRGQLVQVFSTVPEASAFGCAGAAILFGIVALRRRRK
jgi:CHRD domain